MTIIYSKKVTPAARMRIRQSDAFIAIITKDFIKEDRFEECRWAEELNKPMYAVISDKKLDWEKVKSLPWRKIFYVEDYKSKEDLVKEIEKDLKWYRSIGA